MPRGLGIPLGNDVAIILIWKQLRKLRDEGYKGAGAEQSIP